MKRVLIFLAMMFWCGACLAAGTCVQTVQPLPYARDARDAVVMLACTGDAADGSVPSIVINDDVFAHMRGKYLYQIIAYPTAGGVAPDGADVTVTMDGQDLLGGKGAGLISASSTYDVFPYSLFMNTWRYPIISNSLTVTISNQATPSATYTILLKCVR